MHEDTLKAKERPLEERRSAPLRDVGLTHASEGFMMLISDEVSPSDRKALR